MALIPPFFLDCVVAIGHLNNKGETEFTATGFLYGRFAAKIDAEQNNYNVYLISNRHVFQGQAEARVRFNPMGEAPAREYRLALSDGTGKVLWFGHPDPEVDVAAVPINVALLRSHGIDCPIFQDDEHILTQQGCRDQGVSEGDGIYTLGFPMGLAGEKRNYVIVRQGVIARIRDALAGHRKEFLIDTAIFPGNSGGPVVTKPEMVAIQGTKPLNRACLIGLVASYVPYIDVAVSQQTKRPRITFEENSGLAAAFPIDFVAEVIDAQLNALKAQGQPQPRGEKIPTAKEPQ